MNAGSAFWTQFGSNAAAASLIAGKWPKVPSSSGSFGSLSSLVNLPSLLSGLLAKENDTFARGATKTVDRQQVVALNDTTKGGTLYVATTGPAYPIEITKSGAGGGHLTFSKFNAVAAPTVPAHALDLSQLHG